MLLGYYSVGKEENSANFLFTVFTVVSNWMWCCKFLIRFCGKIGIVVGLVSQMGTFFSSICGIFLSLDLGRGYSCIFLYLGLYIFFLDPEGAGVVSGSFVLPILFFYFVCSS